MVSYQQWFEVVHEAVPNSQLDRDGRARLTRQLAAYWHDNKAELQAMTKRQAADHAHDIVEH